MQAPDVPDTVVATAARAMFIHLNTDDEFPPELAASLWDTVLREDVDGAHLRHLYFDATRAALAAVIGDLPPVEVCPFDCSFCLDLMDDE